MSATWRLFLKVKRKTSSELQCRVTMDLSKPKPKMTRRQSDRLSMKRFKGWIGICSAVVNLTHQAADPLPNKFFSWSRMMKSGNKMSQWRKSTTWSRVTMIGQR